MREIKFRGKDKDGKWHYGFIARVQEDNSEYSYFITEDTTRHQRNVRQVSFEVLPESVGQFTGLKDKNEVEIYEGDIAKVGIDSFTGEIYYNDYEWHCKDENDKDFHSGDYYHGFMMDWEDISIIGNKHDK